MAALLMIVIQRYIGTAAERAGTSTTRLEVGSLFHETDTQSLYIWDGAAWNVM